jgi:hypothetical protein
MYSLANLFDPTSQEGGELEESRLKADEKP